MEGSPDSNFSSFHCCSGETCISPYLPPSSWAVLPPCVPLCCAPSLCSSLFCFSFNYPQRPGAGAQFAEEECCTWTKAGLTFKPRSSELESVEEKCEKLCMFMFLIYPLDILPTPSLTVLTVQMADTV